MPKTPRRPLSNAPHHPEESGSRFLILWGLLAGVIVGLAFNYWGDQPLRAWLLKNIIDPTGQIFLRSLFLIVVPLVFSSLAVGIANLGSAEVVSRLSWRLGGYYVVTSAIAILIGQALVLLIHPGGNIAPEVLDASRESMANQVSGLMEKSLVIHESFWPGILYKIIPSNALDAMGSGNMLGVIFTALLVGLALVHLPHTDKTQAFRHILEALSDIAIKVVGWIMKLAPIAVAALMISVVSQLGMEVLKQLSLYVLVVLFGFVIHATLTYGFILRAVIGMGPIEFIRKAMPTILTAFSTSSSSATMPASIRTLQNNFKVPRKLATFSIPLGATINMDGTALFEVVAALFIAQVFGIEISLAGHITLALLVLVTSIGVAGIPGASIPLIMAAMATVGIPPEGIALILGVDRLLDMCRTVINVVGDLVGALYLAKISLKHGDEL